MHPTVAILFIFAFIHFQSGAQNLINSKKDTLRQSGTFYYTTLKEKKNFRHTLDTGLYVLIFDVNVDLEKLQLKINRPYDAPIIYLKHNGYISFEVKKWSVADFDFSYDGKLQPSGVFAKLYRKAPQILIGSPCPDFKLKKTSGSYIEKSDLLDNVTIFLLWNPTSKFDHTYYQLLNEIAADYPQVKFVALSDALSLQVKKFKDQNPDSNFMFANDEFHKLGIWTKMISGHGCIVLIMNKNGLLEYKNIIWEDHVTFQEQLEDNVREKLNSLI